MVNIREKAQRIINARTKATPAPLKAEREGSEGFDAVQNFPVSALE